MSSIQDSFVKGATKCSMLVRAKRPLVHTVKAKAKDFASPVDSTRGSA